MGVVHRHSGALSDRDRSISLARVKDPITDPQAVGEGQRRGSAFPASLNANCRRNLDVDLNGAAFSLGDDLNVAEHSSVLGVIDDSKSLDSFVTQQYETAHAEALAKASAHNKTSSALAWAWAWVRVISSAACRSSSGMPARGCPSSSAAATANSTRSGRAIGCCCYHPGIISGAGLPLLYVAHLNRG